MEDRVPFYTITDAARERLREPRGSVFEGEALIDHLNDADYPVVVCVGDRVARDVTGAGLTPDICIEDGKERREPVDAGLGDFDADIVLGTDNPAGTITHGAWNTVREASAHTCPVQVSVDGEEDLLALPALLFAPTGAAVVYGQWDRGAVVMTVDDELRAFARDILGIDRHEHVIVGGSWDRFHAGHRYILLAALEHGKRVDVGITSDDMLARKIDHRDFDPFDERQAAVTQFLGRMGADRANTMRIDDFRGNAVREGDALVVTDETRKNADRINKERESEGRPPLDIVELSRITGTDGEVISATRIRAGDIDRDGRPQTP